MVDYQTLTAGLERAAATFANISGSLDPPTVAAVKTSFNTPEALTVGTMYLYLFNHAGPSAVEMADLEAVLSLWTAVRDVSARIGDVGAALEDLNQTPPNVSARGETDNRLRPASLPSIAPQAPARLPGRKMFAAC